jgi:ATP-dependent exoDNAse (exonuclease V) alpha subunit
MKAGGRLIKVKTDAVVVEGGCEVECGDGIGNYRPEKVALDFKLTPSFCNNYKYELTDQQWNDKVTSGHRLLYGSAGTGKTTTIKKDLKNLGRYKLLASTNKASRILGGQTIHFFFGITLDGAVDYNYALKVVQDVDTLVIDEASMIKASIYEVLYFIKSNKPDLKFVLVGDSKQLRPVERHQYDYFNSFVVQELVDYQRQELTVNKRSNNQLFELFSRVMELGSDDFNNDFTERNLCYTNKKRIEINKKMMEIDSKKKKSKAIRIEKNELDDNSQDVVLMKGFPVIAIKPNKKLGFVNGDTFKVTSVAPLVIKCSNSNTKIEITSDEFKQYFYINYCSTVHKTQGETITKPYSIHEWERMDKRLRYTAISRATSKELINVIKSSGVEYSITADTNQTLLKRRQAEHKRCEKEIYRKRKQSLTIINSIVRYNNSSEEYCLKHTSISKVELFKHLGITEGIPCGYEVDHIKPRKEYKTIQELETVNHYTNLRLLPKIDNIKRNFQ